MIESEKTIIINMLTRPAMEGGNNLAGRKQTIKACLVNDHGTWTVRAKFQDADGVKRNHSKSTGFKVDGHNRRRAEAAMREIVAEWERQASTTQPSVNPCFGTCVKQWLDRKRLTIRANTLESYRDAAKVHIIPVLGEIGICDLTRCDLQGYYEGLQRDGLSVSTMKKHRVIIRGVLSDAVLDGILSVNVSDQVRLPKAASKYEGKALSEAQVETMLDRLEEQPVIIRTAVMLAVLYALRRSEICGLRWKDVDFERGVIHVRNTVVEYRGVLFEQEATKTKASCRDLCFIPGTEAYFKELFQEQKRKGNDTGKVCAHEDGRLVRPEYISRACKRFIKECGFEGVHLHDLRHTAATILARRLPVKHVQKYLGHEDVHTTLAIYTHALPDDSLASAQAMGELFNGAGFLSSRSEKDLENGLKPVDNIIPLDGTKAKKLGIR